MEKVKREGKLVIATHPVNPPFEFGAGTGVDGFDYDLTEAIARGLGVKTQWIKKQFEQCFEYLDNGEVDMVVNAVTITPEREVKYLFSSPYYTTGQIIANGYTDHREPEALKNIGVEINTMLRDNLRGVVPKGRRGAERTKW